MASHNGRKRGSSSQDLVTSENTSSTTVLHSIKRLKVDWNVDRLRQLIDSSGSTDSAGEPKKPDPPSCVSPVARGTSKDTATGSTAVCASASRETIGTGGSTTPTACVAIQVATNGSTVATTGRSAAINTVTDSTGAHMIATGPTTWCTARPTEVIPAFSTNEGVAKKADSSDEESDSGDEHTMTSVVATGQSVYACSVRPLGPDYRWCRGCSYCKGENGVNAGKCWTPNRRIRVAKWFVPENSQDGKLKLFHGTVDDYDRNGNWHVTYDDADDEMMEREELDVARNLQKERVDECLRSLLVCMDHSISVTLLRR